MYDELILNDIENQDYELEQMALNMGLTEEDLEEMGGLL